MDEWEVSKPLGQCCGTGKKIEYGEEYFATLVETEEGLQRRDYCSDYWQKTKPDVFCYWRTKLPNPEQKKQIFVDDEMLMAFFERLERESEQEWLLVEEQPLKKGRDTFTARLGKSLYLKESMDMFDVAEKKTANAIAAIALTDAGLTLSLLKEDRFPGMRAAPKNVLGETYVVRTESGKDFHVTFTNV